MEARLERRYKTPSISGSFQGPSKVYSSAKADGINTTRERVEEALEKQESYTLNKPVIRKFPRNRVIVEGFDSQWDSDLADFVLLSTKNSAFKYVLLMIDIFSRYVWVRPLKTKLAKEVVKAVDSILKEGRQPKLLRTDGGREYNNQALKTFLAQKGIHHFSTNNETQANYAERAIKTIKSKLYRYMVENNTLKYIDVLQDIVKSYNNTIHSSLGISPAEVNKGNEAEIRYEQYVRRPKTKYKTQRFKFKVGDKVRIAFTRGKFDREYGQRWSGEVFLIVTRRKRDGIPIYTLKDWNGEPIKGTFYQQQLQKVNVNDGDLFKIEKILKRRRKNGKKQVYVHWLRWPKKFRSWIDENTIQE